MNLKTCQVIEFRLLGGLVSSWNHDSTWTRPLRLIIYYIEIHYKSGLEYPFLDIIWSSRGYHLHLVSYRIKSSLLNLIHEAVHRQVSDCRSSCIFPLQLPNPLLQPHRSPSFWFIDSFIVIHSFTYSTYTHISFVYLRHLVRWIKNHHVSSIRDTSALLGHLNLILKDMKVHKIQRIFIIELNLIWFLYCKDNSGGIRVGGLWWENW